MLANINNNSSDITLATPKFTQSQIDTIKNTICRGASNEELSLFMAVTERTGLDPFARQIFAVKRKEKQPDGKYKEILSIQISIDGFRLIAARTGKYQGQLGPYWCGKDGQWHDIWLEDKPPMAAKVGVLHADFKEPLYRVAKFWSYAQTVRSEEKESLNHIWKKFPDLMIAKCAEALALRSAFPQDLSGLYTPDEMSNSETQHDIIDIVPTPTPTRQVGTEEYKKNQCSEKVLDMVRLLNMSRQDAVALLQSRYQKSTRDQLSLEQLEDLIIHLEARLNASTHQSDAVLEDFA